jgi:pyrroline-5-carboxylate reductase
LLKSKFSKAAELTSLKEYFDAQVAKRKRNRNNRIITMPQLRKVMSIILAVKPFQVADVLNGIKKDLTTDKMLISVVTGGLISEMEDIVKKSMAYFRAMPNTAIAIQESMTCICSRNANEATIKYVERFVQYVGKVVTIDEKLMEAATILAAVRTAYAMRYIRRQYTGRD